MLLLMKVKSGRVCVFEMWMKVLMMSVVRFEDVMSVVMFEYIGYCNKNGIVMCLLDSMMLMQLINEFVIRMLLMRKQKLKMLSVLLRLCMMNCVYMQVMLSVMKFSMKSCDLFKCLVGVCFWFEFFVLLFEFISFLGIGLKFFVLCGVSDVMMNGSVKSMKSVMVRFQLVKIVVFVGMMLMVFLRKCFGVVMVRLIEFDSF